MKSNNDYSGCLGGLFIFVLTLQGLRLLWRVGRRLFGTQPKAIPAPVPVDSEPLGPDAIMYEIPSLRDKEAWERYKEQKRKKKIPRPPNAKDIYGRTDECESSWEE